MFTALACLSWVCCPLFFAAQITPGLLCRTAGRQFLRHSLVLSLANVRPFGCIRLARGRAPPASHLLIPTYLPGHSITIQYCPSLHSSSIVLPYPPWLDLRPNTHLSRTTTFTCHSKPSVLFSCSDVRVDPSPACLSSNISMLDQLRFSCTPTS